MADPPAARWRTQSKAERNALEDVKLKDVKLEGVKEGASAG